VVVVLCCTVSVGLMLTRLVCQHVITQLLMQRDRQTAAEWLVMMMMMLCITSTPQISDAMQSRVSTAQFTHAACSALLCCATDCVPFTVLLIALTASIVSEQIDL